VAAIDLPLRQIQALLLYSLSPRRRGFFNLHEPTTSTMKLFRTLAPLMFAASLTPLPAVAQTTAESATANPRSIVIDDVSHSDFSTTLANLKQQLKADGWNIVAEINLGEGLAKRDVRIPGGMVVLKLTSGKNAVPLLKDEATRYVSAMIPCGVSVYGMSDGRVMISRLNAGLMADMMEPRVAEVMRKSAANLDASIARALSKAPR
jgi:uncharacterized protein (DUF302 family)